MSPRFAILLWLLAAGALVACEAVGPLDLDVVVSSVEGEEGGTVQVFPRWRDRYCENSFASWPADGDCVTRADTISWSCSDPPTRCIERVRVTRRDYTVGEATFEPYDGSVWIRLPALGPEADYSLEIEGCGGRARVALPSERMDGLDLEEILFDGDEATVRWAVAGTGAPVLVSKSYYLHAVDCLVEDTGEKRVAVSDYDRVAGLTLGAVRGGEELATAVGTVRLWRVAERSLGVWGPRCDWTAGGWLLPGLGERLREPDLALWLDPEHGDPVGVRLEWATYRERSGGVELRFSIRFIEAVAERPSAHLQVVVGPEGERWQLLDDRSVLAFAERSESGALSGLVPGSPAPASIRFHPAPVDLQALEDPADALHFELSLDWDLGLVLPQMTGTCP